MKKMKKRRVAENPIDEPVDEPVASCHKKPCCFKRLSDKSRPTDVHYFSNPKSWMTSDVTQAVLTLFNRKLLFEEEKGSFESR